MTGDLVALAAGQRAMLRQTGRTTLSSNLIGRAQLVIESLPPDSSPERVAQDLYDLARMQTRRARGGESSDALPIADVADCGTSAAPVRIVITLIRGTDLVAAQAQLAAFDGITTQAPAAYPGPLAALLRAWAEQHRGEDLHASLTRFEDAICQGRAGKSDVDP